MNGLGTILKVYCALSVLLFIGLGYGVESILAPVYVPAVLYYHLSGEAAKEDGKKIEHEEKFTDITPIGIKEMIDSQCSQEAKAAMAIPLITEGMYKNEFERIARLRGHFIFKSDYQPNHTYKENQWLEYHPTDGQEEYVELENCYFFFHQGRIVAIEEDVGYLSSCRVWIYEGDFFNCDLVEAQKNK